MKNRHRKNVLTATFTEAALGISVRWPTSIRRSLGGNFEFSHLPPLERTSARPATRRQWSQLA